METSYFSPPLKEFAKENITIFEMKKADTTLEEAFMTLIKEGGEE